MLNAFQPAPDAPPVSHNVMGQRLGRKGQETRERILAAFCAVLAGPPERPVTLTGVAREAGVGMSTCYLYFPDLGALVLAGLHRIMETVRIDFIETVKTRWPDTELRARCVEFTRQHYAFWRSNCRILHLRNSFADANDERFLDARHRTSIPLVKMLAAQMEAEPGMRDPADIKFAMVLLTGLERLSTVVTNPYFPFTRDATPARTPDHVRDLIAAEAELIEIAIAHRRRRAARLTAAA